MSEPNPYSPTEQVAEIPRQGSEVAQRTGLRWQLIPALLSLLLAVGFGVAGCFVFLGFCGVIRSWDQHSNPTAEVLTSFISTAIVTALAVMQILAAKYWLRSRHFRATAYTIGGVACYYAASLARRDSLYDAVRKLTVVLGFDSG